MEISADKTKLITKSAHDIQWKIEVKGQKLGTVTSFKYFGAVGMYKTIFVKNIIIYICLQHCNVL